MRVVRPRPKFMNALMILTTKKSKNMTIKKPIKKTASKTNSKKSG
jgi:hypothetical protein